MRFIFAAAAFVLSMVQQPVAAQQPVRLYAAGSLRGAMSELGAALSRFPRRSQSVQTTG
jgi:hypothetical protein